MDRCYDKGERRHKHVGKGPTPVIAISDEEPKKRIGKCPSTLSDSDKTRLLNEAIAAPNGDCELPVPKKLYVVHEGAIYEARTSDRGRTYHGYPYAGKLSKAVLAKLEAMAYEKSCVDSYRRWVNTYIEEHGAHR
ncbi:MAG: hypothetical protein HQL41_18940 [Alphaproteobacteria bacterium]|nr:hypothetical protein [Alphaproteobacteria bacterium]